METKRWAEPCDLNLCIFRSRRRTGRCEFSTRLFSRNRPGLWRSAQLSARAADRYEYRPSVKIASGRTSVLFSMRRKNLTAAALLRRFCTRTSRTSPSSSTARHMYMRMPAIFTTISSRCQRGVGDGRVRRRLRAITGPNFNTPATDGLVADLDAALGEQIFNVPEAHREPEVCPDGVLDDIGREAVALEGDGIHGLLASDC